MSSNVIIELKMFRLEKVFLFWYQHKNTISNLNIFSLMMSVEDMVTRTAGGPGCDSPGDYLR